MLKTSASGKQRSLQKSQEAKMHMRTREDSESSNRNSRVKHHLLMTPLEQLQEYTRKQLIANSKSSTTKLQYSKIDKHRFQDDNNIISLADLIESNHMNAEVDQVPPPSSEERQDSSQKTLKESALRSDNLKSSLQNDDDLLTPEDELDYQNFEDYAQGEQADNNQQQARQRVNGFRKYVKDNGDTAKTEGDQSYLRMQLVYVDHRKKALQMLREDNEIIRFMQQYRLNKKNLQRQLARKHQIAVAMTRALKSATKVDNIKTETMNLPMIPTNKKEIALGGISEEAEEKKLKAVQGSLVRISKSKSESKLGYTLGQGRSCKDRDRNKDKDTLEGEMQQLGVIQRKLRSKNVVFTGSTLRKGLINIRMLAEQDLLRDNPEKSLPSNAFYKKFPLGY